MFDSTHPFAFFDYFRVPYRLVPGPAGSAFGRLWRPDGGGSLVWPLVDPAAGDPGGLARPGRYELGGSPIFGHVLPDAATRPLLDRWGTGWRVARPVLDSGGRHVASVWRDDAGSVFLPFDPGELMHQFWSEGYRDLAHPGPLARLRPALVRAYYGIRPALPRPAQIAARRVFARTAHRAPFPAWPVEPALHDLYDLLFDLVVAFAGRPVPWLDLWPDGRAWAVVLTHDVETEQGCRNLPLLRDIERDLGHPSAWNFVPLRYRVDESLLRDLRAQGCEIGVHGVRHDGRDLGSLRLLRRRLPVLREYARRWGAVGFRSPATQRNWAWMPLLGFDYDMSYHDTAPYEPTPGGSCSYLPYFIGDLVELPITLAQDHTLFTILGHPDAAVWLTKAAGIRARGGMLLVLTHPDYADDPRETTGYRRLLESIGDDRTAWWATPAEVSTWWRRRAASRAVETGAGWVVAGAAAGSARVVFAGAETGPLRHVLPHVAHP